jgi:CMP-N-acetylneuraminic acid synthetase/spore coat polysaccharide biosynthesis predicted glycosyltransferase SpsG
MKTLAVISARKNSKGIPRKNMRFMNGKPLIAYAINIAKLCGSIADTVVTSDDDEVLAYAALLGVETILRDVSLAEDDVTLDPVVFDAVCRTEKQKNIKYDCIITLQPTSPLLKATSLRNAINKFVSSGADTMISAVNKPRLSWRKGAAGYSPNYSARLNRQELPADYAETGAFVISGRDFVRETSRIGGKISIYELPETESIDIDDIADWAACEMLLKRKKIVFRVDGHRDLGMGHIHHALTLAYRLTGHDVIFVCDERHLDGINKIRGCNFTVKTICDNGDFFSFLQNNRTDIVVNDCLNTEAEYMQTLKAYAERVVTIEDVGEGARFADAVINALYEKKHENIENCYNGKAYVCLREEFQLASPKPFSEAVGNVFIMFGGSDPANLSKKVYEFAIKNHIAYPAVQFHFVTGLSYDADENGLVTREDSNIFIHSNARVVSGFMRQADLAVTSQGRGAYEIASLGVPAIVMSQNTRETMHDFVQMENGFINLGLGKNVSDETLENTFRWLYETPQVRKNMRELMLKSDLKPGIDRVIRIILNER